MLTLRQKKGEKSTKLTLPTEDGGEAIDAPPKQSEKDVEKEKEKSKEKSKESEKKVKSSKKDKEEK